MGDDPYVDLLCCVISLVYIYIIPVVDDPIEP